MAEHPLEKHARRLEKHIKRYGGHLNSDDLAHHAYRHEDAMEDAMDNGERHDARYHGKEMDRAFGAAEDVRSAYKAVKSYSQGHNMAHHGEGKPYGA